jgi:hypothetical protein
MRKISATIFVLFWILMSFNIVCGQEVSIDSIDIEITTSESFLSIVETYSIDAESSETLSFWIQEDPINLKILIDGISLDYNTTLPNPSNKYFCNISDLNITTDTNIQVSYLLDKDTSEFEKVLQYNANSILISFDGSEIYEGSNFYFGNSFTVVLQKPPQAETVTVESIPMWVYGVIVILIIFLLVSFLFRSKKQKTTKSKESVGGSVELLSTKKALLMEVLKDIEKKHRAKEISDNTYHKLKDKYKQEAVEAMKQLEDMESKVR